MPDPRMSVILATDRYETIRPVVLRLRQQTLQVAGSSFRPRGSKRRDVRPRSAELQGFAGVRILSVESLQPLGAARARGVHAATAPLVFVGETHTYPHPTWAEALLPALEESWAAVAPGFGNANPTNALSWANFLLDYGPWLHGLPPREMSMVPTHNSGYKREVLLALGPRLATALMHGDQLTVMLREMGHRTFFQPAARIDHLNLAHPDSLGPGAILRWVADGRAEGGAVVCAQARRLSVRVATDPRGAARPDGEAPPGCPPRSAPPRGNVPGTRSGCSDLCTGRDDRLRPWRGSAPRAEPQMLEYEVHKLRYASRR